MKASKYGVISGPNTRKYRSEITPYLDTFHAVTIELRGNLEAALKKCSYKNVF